MLGIDRGEQDEISRRCPVFTSFVEDYQYFSALTWFQKS